MSPLEVEKPFRIDQWVRSKGEWEAFRECTSRPEAEMFMRHYRSAGGNIRWRIVDRSANEGKE